MRLTCIELGGLPPPLDVKYPRYGGFFETLFKGVDPELDFEIVRVASGEALPDPTSLEAVFITGAPQGVGDDVPWMSPLIDFIRWCSVNEIPMAGVCFGHQIMATALGGHVQPAEAGWGIGRHVYQMTARRQGFAAGHKTLAMSALHRDQVVRLPPGAKSIGKSEFCPNAILEYTQFPAVSVQGHIELSPKVCGDIYDHLPVEEISGEVKARAMRTFVQPMDGELIAREILLFLKANM